MVVCPIKNNQSSKDQMVTLLVFKLPHNESVEKHDLYCANYTGIKLLRALLFL